MVENFDRKMFCGEMKTAGGPTAARLYTGLTSNPPILPRQSKLTVAVAVLDSPFCVILNVTLSCAELMPTVCVR